jgi:hypothetical protein
VLDTASGALKFPIKDISCTVVNKIRNKIGGISFASNFDLWFAVSSKTNSSGGSFNNDKAYLVSVSLEGDAITVTN